MVDDWTLVVPEADKVQETAVLLLSLADSPHDVRTTAGGTEFRIPPYLADRYTAPAPVKRRRAKKEEGDD